MNDIKEKRRSRDAQRTVERLHYKFITMYVKGLHQDVYRQAEELHRHAKRENPRVKDLTKTTIFMNTVMPDKPIPRHYMSRRREHLIPQTPQTQPQMVLRIPLLPLPITLPEVSTSLPEVSTSLPEVSTSLPEVSTSLPEVSTSLPEVSTSLPEVSTSLPEVSTSLPEVSTSLPEVSTSLPDASNTLLLSSDVYESLLNELRKDPDLWRILNEFPFQDNATDDFTADEMNDFVASDMGDSFIADDLTPLEIELENGILTTMSEHL